jgi:hypothetical protein
MKRAAGISLRALGVAILPAASVLTYWVFAPDSWKYASKIAIGYKDARNIDAYRERTGRLPAKLEDVGISVDLSGPIFYDRCSDTRYVLWFGTTLGDSMSFDSDDRKRVSLDVVCR